MRHEHRYFKVAPGIWGMKIVFVNVYAVASNSHWVLIDAGLPGSAQRILRMADDLFNGVPPSAIILTHGHFDHRGALHTLLETWKVPVFAHRLEWPYLTGRSAYPPPDPTVRGGLMSLLSFLYPKRPIDISEHLKALPDDGSVPFLPEWETIFVPGHAPGQAAFFRRSDGVLIAGDAFVTTRQESALATLSALPLLSGPPKYFTYDWDAAKASVVRLNKLSPKVAATGHGLPMRDEQLREGLQNLATHFDQQARPQQGRYAIKPAVTGKDGVVSLPRRRLSPGFAIIVVGLAATALILLKSK